MFINYLAVSRNEYDGEIRVTDAAREVGADWQRLARALELPDQDIRQIRQEFSGHEPLTVLRIWITLKRSDATGKYLNNYSNYPQLFSVST
jgi:hypothetical protein